MSELDAIVFANARERFLQEAPNIKPGDTVTFGGTRDGEPFIDDYAWTVIRPFEATNDWLLARPASPRELFDQAKYSKAILAAIGITQLITLSVSQNIVVDLHSVCHEFYLQTGQNIQLASSFEDIANAIDGL